MLDIAFQSPSEDEAAAVANEYAKVASQYIADTMATDKPSMMSVALVPANPVSPDLTKNLILGFLLGVVLACGIITVRMLMDDKYKTAEDIRKYTGLATLAIVPLEKSTGSHREKGARSTGRAAGTVSSLAVSPDWIMQAAKRSIRFVQTWPFPVKM